MIKQLLRANCLLMINIYMGFSDTVYYIHLLPDRLMKSPRIDWEKIDQVGLEAGLWLD